MILCSPLYICNHQLLVTSVSIGYCFHWVTLRAVEEVGRGDMRREMTHFNLFWNKQVITLEKEDASIYSTPTPTLQHLSQWCTNVFLHWLCPSTTAVRLAGASFQVLYRLESTLDLSESGRIFSAEMLSCLMHVEDSSLRSSLAKVSSWKFKNRYRPSSLTLLNEMVEQINMANLRFLGVSY